jgi:hypothetical protein
MDLSEGPCLFRTGRLTRETYNVVAGSETIGWGVLAGVAAGSRNVEVKIVEAGRLSLSVSGPGGETLAGTKAPVAMVDGAHVMVPYIGMQDGDRFYGRMADEGGRINLRVPAGKLTIDLLGHKFKGRVEVEVQPGATVARKVTLREPR